MPRRRSGLLEIMRDLEEEALNPSLTSTYLHIPFVHSFRQNTPFEEKLISYFLPKLDFLPDESKNDSYSVGLRVKAEKAIVHAVGLPREYAQLRTHQGMLRSILAKLDAKILNPDTPKQQTKRLKENKIAIAREIRTIDEVFLTGPKVRTDPESHHDAINENYRLNEQPVISVDDLLAIRPIFPELLEKIKQRKSGFVGKLEQAVQVEKVTSITNNAIPSFLYLLIAYDRPGKAARILQELPKLLGREFEHRPGLYEQKIILPSDETIAREAKSIKVSPRALKELYSDIISGNHSIKQVARDISAEFAPFYWEQIKTTKDWSAVAGWYRSIYNRDIASHDFDSNNAQHVAQYGDIATKFKQELMTNLSAILPIFDINPRDVDMPLLMHRITKVDFSKLRGTEGDNYDAKELKNVRIKYECAVNAIRAKIGTSVGIPTLDSIVESSRMNEPLEPLNWVTEKFSTPEFDWAHNDPLLQFFIEKERTPYRFAYKHDGGSPIENFVKILPQMQYLSTILSKDHVYSLISDLARLSQSQWVSHIDLFRDESVWKRHGGSDRQYTRTTLTHMVNRSDTHWQAIGCVLVEKVKSMHLIEIVSQEQLFNSFEHNLLGGKRYLNLVQYAPYASFRVLKDFIINPEHSRVVISLIENSARRRKTQYGSYVELNDAELYRIYHELGHKIAPEKFTSQSLKTTLDTLQKFISQKQALEEKFRFSDRDYSENKPKPHEKVSLRYERLEHRIGRILAPHMTHVLELYWKNSFKYALTQIIPKLSADVVVDDIARNIIGIYCTSSKRPKVRQFATRILSHHLGVEQQTPHLTPENSAYLELLAKNGFNVNAWNQPGEEQYVVRTKSASRINQHILRYEQNIETMLVGAGIEFTTLDDGIETAKKTSKDGAFIADLITQFTEYKRSTQKVSDIAQTNATLYLEQEPARRTMMGSWVDGSCLGLGKGSEYSAITNAIDANKRVIFASADGKIIGRKLICLNEFGQIVQYKTYVKGTWDLDEAFEQYALNLAQRCNTGVVLKPYTHRNGDVEMDMPKESNSKIISLNFGEKDWLDDGPVPFGAKNEIWY